MRWFSLHPIKTKSLFNESKSMSDLYFPSKKTISGFELQTWPDTSRFSQTDFTSAKKLNWVQLRNKIFFEDIYQRFLDL